ncbi:recombinase family protein [Paraburkholderia sp. CI3]|uniref:recombinase family protein n=1 Tax=Paraburkholderia sp. CI3 TaxID=2991060 RepID=UPI003D1D1315
MIIGDACVSTREQNVALQVDALRATGCAPVLTEVASGASTERPVLTHLLADDRAGDVIVIWKLDRLGRSMRHLIDVVGVGSVKLKTVDYLCGSNIVIPIR